MTEITTSLHCVLTTQIQSTPKSRGERLTVGEVETTSDYEHISAEVYDNEAREKKDVKNWANKTLSLAQNSIISHLIEIPLRIVSYFISHSELRETYWSKSLFALEKLASTLGGMFRNKIYARKDDNLGAVIAAGKEFNDTTTALMTHTNINLQTKARFLIPIISFFNPQLANDIDRGFIEAFDSSWWRKLTLNTGYYPGMLNDFYDKCKNLIFKVKDEEKKTGEQLTLKFVFNNIKERCKKTFDSWKEYSKEKGTSSEKNNSTFLRFCKSMDKATSTLLPIIWIPSNIIGDTIRPFARRLNLSGFTRNIIRILSVTDRAFIGFNYIFRHYLPELINENELGIDKFKKPSNLYLASLVGDIADLPLTIFEDKIKESSNWIQHSIEILRILKDSAFNIFWSARRITSSKKILKEK